MKIKRSHELKPGDVFQAVGRDIEHMEVLEVNDGFCRFKILRTQEIFAEKKYAIENMKGYKYLGRIRHYPKWQRILACGLIPKYKIIKVEEK